MDDITIPTRLGASQIIDGMSGYWEADCPELVFTPASLVFLSHLLGLDFLGTCSWADILKGEGSTRALDCLRKACQDGHPFSFETSVATGTGYKWIRVVGGGSDASKLHGFITDCTHIQQEASNAEDRHQGLVEGIPASIICYEWETRRIVSVNEHAVEQYGFERDQFLSMTIEDVWPDEVRSEYLDRMQNLDPTKPARGEWLHRRANGQPFFVNVASHGVIQGDKKCRVAVVTDVTDRKAIEQSLRLSNERLTLMTGVTGTVIGSLPLADQAKQLADQVRLAFQVDACVIRVLHDGELVLLGSTGIDAANLPERIPATKGFAAEVMDARRSIAIPEAIEHGADHNPFLTPYLFVSYAGAPLIVKDQILGVMAIYSQKERHEFTDVDLAHLQIVANNIAVAVLNDELYEEVRRQKEAQELEIQQRIAVEEALTKYSEELRESEDRLRLVTEASTDGIWVWDRDSDTITWSDRVHELLRYDESVASARLSEALQIVHPDDRRNFLPSLIRETRKHGPFRVELRLRKGDGTYGHYQVHCMLARDRNDRVVRMVGSIHDIMERMQRDREMEAVAAISLALREVETTEEMLPIISEQIARILDIRSVGLALVDPETDVVVIRHVSGVFQQLVGVRFEKQQGFVGRVYGDAEEKFSANITDDPTSIMRSILDRPTAVLGVPLVARGEVIGVLWLGKPVDAMHSGTEFSASESRLLGVLAEIAAAALRRVALREKTEFHLHRLHSLSIIHATVSENLNLRTTLDMLLEQLKAQTRIDAAAIHLFEPVSSTFKLETSSGFVGGLLVPPLGRELIATRRRAKLAKIEDATPRGRRFGPMISAGFVSYMAVPLIANENLLGVLELYHRTELPQDVDLDNFAEMLASQAAVAVDNATLLKSLRTANRDLIEAYDATIEGWARALDLRDHETEGHSRRVTDMTVELAKLVGVPTAQLSDIRRGALLHDIGKMAIPDSVLHKPGELDQSELIIMRRHPGIALDLLEPVKFLKSAIDIPFCHHERWDGHGYPRGLKREEIPLSARIFAVVDVWDALRSDRPYRKRWSTEQAVQFIRVQSGRQFDPEIVEIFIENIDKFSGHVEKGSIRRV